MCVIFRTASSAARTSVRDERASPGVRARESRRGAGVWPRLESLQIIDLQGREAGICRDLRQYLPTPGPIGEGGRRLGQGVFQGNAGRRFGLEIAGRRMGAL